MHNLYDELLRASSVLHWIGKYEVANALILFVRFLRASNVSTLDQFERVLAAAEAMSAERAPEEER